MDDKYDLSNLRSKPKRKNSRTKGNTFERQVAKLLNDRFKTTEFSRSPGSGAFATTHRVPDHLKIYGDLLTPEKFKFCIECKKGYNNLNLYSLYNNSSELWKFIEQIDEHKDKSVIAGVLQKLPLKDARTILNAMKTEFGVDTKVKFNCSNCKEVSVVELPIDANFFDVN